MLYSVRRNWVAIINACVCILEFVYIPQIFEILGKYRLDEDLWGLKGLTGQNRCQVLSLCQKPTRLDPILGKLDTFKY